VAHARPLSRSQQFNEIMPCIYSQFMEKEARQWRQIYKVCHDMVIRLAQLGSLQSRRCNYSSIW
jgi:hypothetical protein